MSELTGQVAAIYISLNESEPMQPVERTWAISERGLWNDRYATRKGFYSASKQQKIRHVSLIGREAILEANRMLSEPFDEAETRRNIVTEGLDLNQLVGKIFYVGNVAMYGTELCDPCNRPDKLATKNGFARAYRGFGGLRAQILTSGLITVHDTLVPAIASLDAIPKQDTHHSSVST